MKYTEYAVTPIRLHAAAMMLVSAVIISVSVSCNVGSPGVVLGFQSVSHARHGAHPTAVKWRSSRNVKGRKVRADDAVRIVLDLHILTRAATSPTSVITVAPAPQPAMGWRGAKKQGSVRPARSFHKTKGEGSALKVCRRVADL